MTQDQKDQTQSRLTLIGLLLVIGLFIMAAAWFLPDLAAGFSSGFEEGLGLKDAIVYGFFMTLVVLLILTFAAGDGLMGELTVLVSVFFVFWFVFSLLLAWIF